MSADTTNSVTWVVAEDADPAESRYEDYPEFNRWLDEQYGGFEINEENVYFNRLASEILFEMDQAAYWQLKQDYDLAQEEEIKRIVIEEFPTPIAYHFRRAQRGAESDLQRLQFLRDTWESLISMLHAIVLGESRVREVPLKSSGIVASHFKSDSLARRLDNIRNTIDAAQSAQIELKTAAFITSELVDQLKSLNQVRNGFSHTAALSETQARKIYVTNLVAVVEILGKLIELRNIKMLRFAGHGKSATMIKHEVFCGSAMVKDFDELNLTSEQLGKCARLLNSHNLLVMIDDSIIPLSPYVSPLDTESGHQTQLCFFKKGKGGKYLYEIVGQSEEIEFEQAMFQDDFGELNALLQK